MFYGLLLATFLTVKAAADDPPLVRKDFNTLPDAAVSSIRKGVDAMMKLDLTDDGTPKADKDLSPLGWKYQASIHGELDGADSQEAWDTCQHSSWFFLSWHRMELYFFEKILRAQSGDATLTLPYWNFSAPPAGMDKTMFGARLPAAFRIKPTADAPNALWWQFRNTNLNKEPGPGDKDEAVPLDYSVVTTADAFKQAAFFTNVWERGGMSFGGGARATPKHLPGGAGEGQIEEKPHNQVHGAVGDGTAKSMSDPGGAALDPIFWPVHANIDRAWSCWQEKHPGTEPKAASWLDNAKFVFFDVETTDGKLSPVRKEMTGREIVDTANQLGYKYDDNCKDFELPAAPRTVLTLASQPRVRRPASPGPVTATVDRETILASQPVTVSIEIPSEVQARIHDLMLAGPSSGAILLTVGGLAVHEATGASYAIYLDLPPGAIPNDQKENVASRLSFFGIRAHSHHMENEDPYRVYDITNVVGQLIMKGEWQADRLYVTFANTAATAHGVVPPPAPSSALARFTFVTLTVE